MVNEGLNGRAFVMGRAVTGVSEGKRASGVCYARGLSGSLWKAVGDYVVSRRMSELVPVHSASGC